MSERLPQDGDGADNARHVTPTAAPPQVQGNRDAGSVKKDGGNEKKKGKKEQGPARHGQHEQSDRHERNADAQDDDEGDEGDD
ncbi:hypothetical protein [Streptomyces sp. I05A-00742]|uniref:hypothetical protein n=1 Tax=Streptomyces sp. I05A-00742 TaxID=2732853 RepID=UPI0014885CC5|nr:hypothetical protein [Streptomyces sp. I05A-00742]